MGFIIFVLLFFFGGYLFVYLIDIIKGETPSAKRKKIDETNDGINNKLAKGEKLDEVEQIYHKENIKTMQLLDDLNKHQNK